MELMSRYTHDDVAELADVCLSYYAYGLLLGGILSNDKYGLFEFSKQTIQTAADENGNVDIKVFWDAFKELIEKGWVVCIKRTPSDPRNQKDLSGTYQINPYLFDPTIPSYPKAIALWHEHGGTVPDMTPLDEANAEDRRMKNRELREGKWGARVDLSPEFLAFAAAQHRRKRQPRWHNPAE